MKSIIRKAFSVSAAAVMISAFAVQAGAYTAEISDTEEYQFNKPYLNINVDGGDIDFSEIVFSLKNSDGEIVASWKGDSDKFNEVADGLYDITDIGNFTTEDWRELPWDKLDKEKIESENPYGDFYRGSAEQSYKELYDSDYVYSTNNCFYECIDSEYLTGETMTVPANTIVLDSDNAYNTNGDDYSSFLLKTYEDESGHSTDVLTDTCFKDYAGKKTEFSVAAGKYRWFLGGWAGGVYATSYEDTQQYVQVKLNLQDLLGSSTVNDNYEFIHTTSKHGTVYCPTIGPKNTDGKVSFAFLSGSVVSAPIPDSDGNICIWLNANDPLLQFQDSFAVTADGWSSFGGGTGHSVKVPTVRSVIKAKFEMPTDGLTLYNIPSGDYTVEIDSSEYALENNTLTVADTKDMQSMNIVLKDAGDSSSESSSETSSEVSSSETSSSDTSSASSEQSSSSEVSSSQASSSTNTSSVTNSKTSSNAASTGNTTNNSNNTPNPATGAAAGFTGIALIAGAAIAVSKKSRK